MPSVVRPTPSMTAARCLVAIAFATGPVAVRADEALDAAVALVRSPDGDLRAVGLERIRDGVRGAAVTQALAGTVLPALDPARQGALLATLADRGDAAALPGITALLDTATEPTVRSAALLALSSLGGGEQVPRLVERLSAGDADAAAARRGLAIIDGPGAADAIRTLARGARGDARIALIELLAARRMVAAAPDLVADTTADDERLRNAAMRALGQLGSAAEVPGMVRGVLRTEPGREREEAERALVAVCTTGRDRERAAAEFLGQFTAAGIDQRRLLVGALGRVGGPRALELVDRLLADPAQRAVGLEALSRWPDATVKDRLLDLLGSATDDNERAVFLGALIRIAPLPNNTLDDKQKLELLRRTMSLCTRDEDRRRVLERANAIRTVDTLRFVVPYLDEPALAEAACLSVVELAHHQQLRDGSKEEFHKALDRVIATTKNAELVERSQRYKEGRTWNRKAPGG